MATGLVRSSNAWRRAADRCAASCTRDDTLVASSAYTLDPSAPGESTPSTPVGCRDFIKCTVRVRSDATFRFIFSARMRSTATWLRRRRTEGSVSPSVGSYIVLKSGASVVSAAAAGWGCRACPAHTCSLGSRAPGAANPLCNRCSSAGLRLGRRVFSGNTTIK